MPRLRMFGIMLLSSLSTCSGLWALPQEVVKKGESATAQVRTAGNGMARQLGSTFRVAPGIFVTTTHVADGDGTAVQLVQPVGDGSQRLVDATVLRRDIDSGLTLLQTRAADAGPALELAGDDQLYDTMDVGAFGFPFRNSFGQAGESPSMSVIPGHVTSLEKKNGVLDRITMDLNLDRGQMGGPVLDSEGRVVGVVQFNGFVARGASTAIPASRVRGLLLRPIVAVEGTSVPYQKRHDEQTLTVDVKSLAEPAPAYDVDLILGAGTQSARSLTSRVSDGVATVRFVPITTRGENDVTVDAKFEKGTISGTTPGRTIRVGFRSVALNAVSSIARQGDGSESIVTLTSGEQITGKVAGVDSVPLELGPGNVTIDLSSAQMVKLHLGEMPSRSIAYTVVVKLKDRVVDQASGAIELTNAPAAGTGPTLDHAGPKVDISAGGVVPPGHAILTPLLGGQGGNLFQVADPQGRDVIGFSYRESVWANRPIVERIEPLYDRGQVPPVGSVVGKEGYVVGGLLVDSDLYTHALRIIFIREQNGHLDPKDNYVSDWLGTPASGQLPKQLAGHGERVIGLCGRRGLNMDAIGLVIEP